MKINVFKPLVYLVAFFLCGSCMLDRSVIRVRNGFPGSVTPNVVCPGETVTVTWDLSMLNADCVRYPRACEINPLTVTVRATGGMTFTNSPAEIVGTQTGIATGPDDITINVHANDRDHDLGSWNDRVEVLGAGEELSFGGSCPGYCRTDGTKGWGEMVATFGHRRLSPGIQIKRIMNTSGVPIILYVFEEGVPSERPINLNIGETTSNFSLRLVSVRAVPQSGREIILGGDCRTGPTSAPTPPSPINLVVTYGCPG